MEYQGRGTAREWNSKGVEQQGSGISMAWNVKGEEQRKAEDLHEGYAAFPCLVPLQHKAIRTKVRARGRGRAFIV